MNSNEAFIHIHQGCFAGTGAIVRKNQSMYNHNKAQQSKNRVHISWDILYNGLKFLTSIDLYDIKKHIANGDKVASNWNGHFMNTGYPITTDVKFFWTLIFLLPFTEFTWQHENSIGRQWLLQWLYVGRTPMRAPDAMNDGFAFP